MIQKGVFPPQTTIVALHTGGLQINEAGSYRK